MPGVEIGGLVVRAGARLRLQLPVARLPTETWMSLPVEVVHGARPGPKLWLSAAVHGDEINGVEIIRQVLAQLDPAQLAGTVFAVPIVNVFGFISQSRYLPDRRDLNRSFPGQPRGSLAARLAYLLMTEVVWHCSYGIDLHTGSHHRTNLPQIRANLHDPQTRRCAEAFSAPVMMHAATRDGSLRQAATASGMHVLLYEGGEALRFDHSAIEIGVQGTLRVLRNLNMFATHDEFDPTEPSIEVGNSTWVRARRGGVFRLEVQLGQHLGRGQRLGVIADAFGDNEVPIKAPHAGLVIGCTSNPLVNQGDGIINLAQPLGGPEA